MISVSPSVSICLPVRNAEPYLDQRIRSIQDQSMTDWDVVVLDGFSNDGSWEKLELWAKQDPRVRLHRESPAGVYQALNRCIELCRGEAIYVATADDTMEPDCLATLAAALRRHRECHLAHCGVRFIDCTGEPSQVRRWEEWPMVRFFGDLINKEHVRPPGHDAVLAFALKTPYHSLTELLIRRSAFDRAGLFRTDWGSFCDMEWQMRATLIGSTVHVPRLLATWRMHPLQASRLDLYTKGIRDGWFVEMADSVIEFSRREELPTKYGLPRRLRRFAEAERAQALFCGVKSRRGKAAQLLKLICTDIACTRTFLKDRLSRRCKKADLFDDLRMELQSLGIASPSFSGIPATGFYENRRLA